ncbi:IS30 family transposase [Lacticaseibacillus paracasei]|nr:IS30 family transposase [Lacticaseibacillus paracasei]
MITVKSFPAIRHLQSAIGYRFIFATRLSPQWTGHKRTFQLRTSLLFPEKTKLNQVSEAVIQRATELINSKPRKCPHWQTPWQAVSKPLSSW